MAPVVFSQINHFPLGFLNQLDKPWDSPAGMALDDFYFRQGALQSIHQKSVKFCLQIQVFIFKSFFRNLS